MNTKKATLNTSAAAVLAGLIVVPAWAFSPANLTDTNGDGVISAAEIREVRRAEKAQYDANGDGELSRDERKAAKQARRAAMVSAFDSDGDGELSRDEREAAKEARMAEIEAQLDVNGDGTVSDAERAGYDEVKQDRRGHKRKGKRRHSDDTEQSS